MSSYWLVVGSVKNWQTAFEHNNIWGLRETQRYLWETISEGDRLIFYATKPVGGLIGCGLVRTKFKQNTPLWPQEFEERKVIWPFRFEFDVEYCLSPNIWEVKKLISKELWPRSGFQHLPDTTGYKLYNLVQNLGYSVGEQPMSSIGDAVQLTNSYTDNNRRVITTHDSIQVALVEIGKLQNFIAEPEYPYETEKFDVVWRRVMNSVPTYVFEVQISGNIYQAIAKLKHAHDIWNSHIFLVSHTDDFNKASSLLSGTFNEINSRLKLIDCNKINKLLELKKTYRDFEKNLGII